MTAMTSTTATTAVDHESPVLQEEELGLDTLETIRVLDPKKYVYSFLSQNVRHDSRTFHSCRCTQVTHNVVSHDASIAAGGGGGGSVHVSLGRTQVIASTSLEVGRPSSTVCPDRGEVAISLHLSHVSGAAATGSRSRGGGSSPQQQQQQQRFAAVESFVSRTIRTALANRVERDQLCIQRGVACWKVTVTCLVLVPDGNLVDACFLAAVAALSQTVMPAIEWNANHEGTASAANSATAEASTVRIIPDDNVKEDEDDTGGEDENDSGHDAMEVEDSNEKQKEQAVTKSGPRRRPRRRLSLKPLPVSLTVATVPPLLAADKASRKTLLLLDPSSMEEDVSNGSITVVMDGHSGKVLGVHKTGTSVVSVQDMKVVTQMAKGRAKEIMSSRLLT